MFLHQTYIPTKTNKYLQQPNAPSDTSNVLKLQTSTPQDSLYNLKPIKSLGTSLAWWIHNQLDINRFRDKVAQTYSEGSHAFLTLISFFIGLYKQDGITLIIPLRTNIVALF